jgi:DNA-binding response OmpR family regulator
MDHRLELIMTLFFPKREIAKSAFMPKITSFLVLEDLTQIREIIVQDIKNMAFKGSIYEASNVSEARKMIKEHQIDFLILDWEIPNQSGYSLLEELRSNDSQYQDTPIMMVSVKDSPRDIRRAIKAGASDYLVKPWTMDEFQTRLGCVWKKHQRAKIPHRLMIKTAG